MDYPRRVRDHPHALREAVTEQSTRAGQVRIHVRTKGAQKGYGIAYDHVGYAVSFCSCCEISTTPIKFHHMTKVCFFDRQSFRLLYHSDIIPMLSKRFLGRLEHRKTGFYDPADKMDHFLFAVLVISLHNDMHQPV